MTHAELIQHYETERLTILEFLRIMGNERRAALDNLTSAQVRCSALLEENRRLKAEMAAIENANKIF